MNFVTFKFKSAKVAVERHLPNKPFFRSQEFNLASELIVVSFPLIEQLYHRGGIHSGKTVN